MRSASARYLADKKQLSQRLQMLRREVASWAAKAELAVNKGRDDLAKAALREKNRFEETTCAVEGDLVHIDVAIEKLTNDAVQLESKLQIAKARQKALILRGQTAKSRIKVKRQMHDLSFNDAFGRIESYERKLDEMEGEIEAYDLGNQSLSEQIQDLEKDEYLTAELETLKSRLGHTPQISHNVEPIGNG